jgi:hypothetical protein
MAVATFTFDLCELVSHTFRLKSESPPTSFLSRDAERMKEGAEYLTC